MKISPVAWAPRCTSEINPTTRPRKASGIASCAAEYKRINTEA